MIPKIIHYCWLSGDDYPQLVKSCLATWRRKLPDYEIILWDKSKFDVNSVEWVKEAYISKKYAFAADYIRLYALYHYGGIYLDSDVEVIKSFDKFLLLNSFIGLESGGYIEAAIIGAEVGSEWVKKCLDYYEGKHFVRSSGDFDTLPLPIIISNVLANAYNLKLDANCIQKLAKLTVFPSEYFSPKNIHTGEIKKTTETIAVHHYDGHWIDKNFTRVFKDLLHIILIKIFGNQAHAKIVKILNKKACR